MALLSNYDPSRHHRRSIRLKGYDYTKPGFYFITLNTHRSEKLFGTIVNGKMILNENGKLVDSTWHDLLNHNGNIRLDAYVIMPDHFHGIIEIITVDDPDNLVVRHALSEIIRQFKTFSAKRINMLADKSETSGRVLNPPRLNPPQPVWQRDYYERIVRNISAIDRIRAYINNNPSKWHGS